MRGVGSEDDGRGRSGDDGGLLRAQEEVDRVDRSGD